MTESLSFALRCLNQDGILNQAHFDLVTQHEDPFVLARSLSSLQKNQLLTATNRSIVAEHKKAKELKLALETLDEARILCKEYFDLIAQHEMPQKLAMGLCDLNAAGKLTPINLNILSHYTELEPLIVALGSLKQAAILTQANFDILTRPTYTTLLNIALRNDIWARIPRYLLTQENFDRLLTAAGHVTPAAELTRLINQMIGIGGRAIDRAFNPGQSTHTASVHRSISASASKLLRCYPNLAIEAITQYLNRLDDSLKNMAAKKCMQRITRINYAFTDQSSGVSTLQLLALAWHGIHDESKCDGELDTRLGLFIDSLYEIQRGYNINELNVDNLGPDAPICDAGTFNKIIEKLKGIHKDIELNYITHDGAMLKFPKLVQTFALKYLSAIASPVTEADHDQVKKLLQDLQEQGIEAIWEKIKVEVERALWDEFQEAYTGNRASGNFLSIIQNIQYVELPPLDGIEDQLRQSLGYQAANKTEAIMSLKGSQLGFFEENQNLSPKKPPLTYLGA